jgi:hypothetical protein
VPKHGQRFTEKLNLGRREAAVLCVLMLRGPQTVGELRGRSERLYQFDDLEGVESTLNRLVEMEFVKKLPRQDGLQGTTLGAVAGGGCGGLPITIWISIENDAHLLALVLVSKPFASQEQPEFERHVETWESGVCVQGDVRDVVHAMPTFLDDALDLG